MVREHLPWLPHVIVEANHDRDADERPLPWFLKQRIRSPPGHLSNQSPASCWPMSFIRARR
jgi:hypothetical protein